MGLTSFAKPLPNILSKKAAEQKKTGKCNFCDVHAPVFGEDSHYVQYIYYIYIQYYIRVGPWLIDLLVPGDNRRSDVLRYSDAHNILA